MAATLTSLPAAKQPSEISVTFLNVQINLLESRCIHFPTSSDQAFLNFPVILSPHLSL